MTQGAQRPTGQATPSAAAGGFNNLIFIIEQVLGKISTATLVQVLSCTNDGGLAPVGSVNVQLLVNRLDGALQATPRGQVYDLPYLRIQGGTDAVIIDPKPGDIGIAVFADRDISSVKANRAQANPGSLRRFSKADGLYFGGVLNGTPVQYIRHYEGGIEVKSPGTITLNGRDVVVHGSHSVSTDVNGYGSRTTFEGGSSFKIDNYTIGADVVSEDQDWSPPKLPDP